MRSDDIGGQLQQLAVLDSLFVHLRNPLLVWNGESRRPSGVARTERDIFRTLLAFDGFVMRNLAFSKGNANIHRQIFLRFGPVM